MSKDASPLEELEAQILALRARVDALERRGKPAPVATQVDLFASALTSVATSGLKEAPRPDGRNLRVEAAQVTRFERSVGCSESNSCSHSPCRCAQAYGVRL